MTALQRIRLDELTEQARQARPGETLLRLAAFLLIAFGRVLGYGWLVPVWCFVMVREGWREVHPPKVSGGRARAG